MWCDAARAPCVKVSAGDDWGRITLVVRPSDRNKTASMLGQAIEMADAGGLSLPRHPQLVIRGADEKCVTHDWRLAISECWDRKIGADDAKNTSGTDDEVVADDTTGAMSSGSHQDPIAQMKSAHAKLKLAELLNPIIGVTAGSSSGKQERKSTLASIAPPDELAAANGGSLSDRNDSIRFPIKSKSNTTPSTVAANAAKWLA